MSEEEWIPQCTEDGSWTLVSSAHGEACHSSAGAWYEARERYAHPCRLEERADATGVLGIGDVGTGLGWNLVAALAAVETRDGAIEAWSFERDRSVLEATLELFAAPERRAGPWERHLDAVLAAFRRALEDSGARGEEPGVPLGARGILHLFLGDARETIERVPEGSRWDAVFLDPFSPRTEPALWEERFLSAVARRMAPGSWLSTYSAAFRVRLALARAGLRVGAGGRVGEKREGTLASPDSDPPPLFPKTARRLARAVDKVF